MFFRLEATRGRGQSYLLLSFICPSDFLFCDYTFFLEPAFKRNPLQKDSLHSHSCAHHFTIYGRVLAVLAETPAARCPPCLNGLTFAVVPQWSHICPPCLHGLTIPSTPHALTNCPATTSTPKSAFLRSRCSPWDLLRAFRVLSSSEPRSAVVAFMRG